MLSTLFAFVLAPGRALADDPKPPANVRFAYICKYGLADGRLTCRDVLGNKLVDRTRVYGYHLIEVYDETAVIAMMKREGFDLTAQVTYSARNTFLYFVRAQGSENAR